MNNKSLLILFSFFACYFMSIKIAFSKTEIDSLQFFIEKITSINSNKDLFDAYNYLSKEKEKRSDLDKTYIYYNLSKIDYTLGFYHDSEYNAVQALKIIDKIADSDFKTSYKKSLYTLLGKIYKALNFNDQALNFYNKSLKIASTTKDSVVIYNNIATTYKANKDFKKANNILLKAKELLHKINDQTEVARILDNLGAVKTILQDPEAYTYLKKSLKIRQKLKDYSQLYPSYKSHFNYYFSKNNIDSAKKYSDLAYNISKLINSPSYQIDAIKLKLKTNNNYNINEFLKLTDSLEKVRNINKNQYSLLKYNVNKSLLETEKQKNQKTIYKFSLIFTIILVVLFLYLLNIRHKKQKLEQIYQTETNISKRIHDEVANDIYKYMIVLNENKLDKQLQLDTIEDIYYKTRDISKEINVINEKSNFKDEIKDLFSSYSNNQCKVVSNGVSDIDWNKINKHKKITIYRVLQELLTNTKKHSQANLVVIKINTNRKKLELQYTDNGIGTNLNFKNGLKNTENRINTLKGTITFDTKPNNGFKAQIII